MLIISEPLSAGQAQAFHQKEFTAKEQNCWSQQGVIGGEWQRGLAVQFALAGGDSTFSAPQSVSLAALVGGDDRVREAHRKSIRVALDQLDRARKRASAAIIYRAFTHAPLLSFGLRSVPSPRSSCFSSLPLRGTKKQADTGRREKT